LVEGRRQLFIKILNSVYHIQSPGSRRVSRKDKAS
jgi:hypothetical protein